MAGYIGPIDDDLNRSIKNKHSALAGDESLGELIGEDPASDEILKLKIKKVLWGHVELNTQNVAVHAKDGFVSLTGKVDSEESRQTIRAIVENIEGVEDVVNYLKIDDGLVN